MGARGRHDPHARPGGLAAIVLAAGEGRRMGMPKALVALDGVALVERHAARLSALGCSPVLVVLRPEIAEVMGPDLERYPSVRLVSVRTRSQAESLALAASALATGDGAGRPAFVVPVDMRPPSHAVVRALEGALGEAVLAATPTYGGRGGHPVLVRPEVLRMVAGPAPLSPDAELRTLRDVLEALGERRVRVAVDDADVLGDFDVPADLPRAARTTSTAG